MNSDGGNLMRSAYFLHPNILYLTLYNYFDSENKRMSLRHCIRFMYRFTTEQLGTLWTRASSGSSERQRERERERESSLGIGLISIQRASPLPTPTNQSSPSPTNHQNINYYKQFARNVGKLEDEDSCLHGRTQLLLLVG